MILLFFVLAQCVVAAVILAVLWGLLKRELLQAASQALEQSAPRYDVTEVSVVLAASLVPHEEARLRSLLTEKFPAAGLNFGVNGGLRGGLVIQAGDLLLDYSLLTRIKHLLGQKDA